MRDMVRPAELRKIALSLAEVEEKPHFDRAAFRTPARIFATLGAKGADCNVRLPPEVQQMLVDAKPDVFTRLNGGWGAAGWTRMEVAAVDAATCREVLKEAHAFAAPKEKKEKVRNARPARRTSGKRSRA
jgi:hypothetical protein